MAQITSKLNKTSAEELHLADQFTEILERRCLQFHLKQILKKEVHEHFESQKASLMETSRDFHQEVVSYMRILEEDLSFERLRVNFPVFPEVDQGVDQATLIDKLTEMFRQEHLFLEQLSQIFQKLILNQPLNDQELQIVSLQESMQDDSFEDPWEEKKEPLRLEKESSSQHLSDEQRQMQKKEFQSTSQNQQQEVFDEGKQSEEEEKEKKKKKKRNKKRKGKGKKKDEIQVELKEESGIVEVLRKNSESEGEVKYAMELLNQSELLQRVMELLVQKPLLGQEIQEDKAEMENHKRLIKTQEMVIGNQNEHLDSFVKLVSEQEKEIKKLTRELHSLKAKGNKGKEDDSQDLEDFIDAMHQKRRAEGVLQM